MKFRTEISPAPWARTIDHSRRGFSVGSCFAVTIAGWLLRYKFPLVSNPTGVLYNPFSIADLLEAAPDRLAEADYVLVTFGTAWVFEEDGRVVANCEKRPAHLFTRRRLSVEEIVERFDSLMDGVLKNKQVVMTVSPVRHLKDGFEENSLSKAVLRLAVDGIVARHPDAAQYFPAYEILNDDLRDYRFYGPDLAHPSAEAAEYVREKFAEAALATATRELLPQIERIVKATEHRPFDPEAEEHAAFRQRMLRQARELAASRPEVDMSAEISFFS